MKERIDNLDLFKIKNLCLAKDNVKRMRTQATDWEKIFGKDISDKGLLSKIYKEIFKLNNKKINNLVKIWTKDLNRPFTQEDTQMANKHM